MWSKRKFIALNLHQVDVFEFGCDDESVFRNLANHLKPNNNSRLCESVANFYF